MRGQDKTMQLNNKQISEFQTLHKRVFGKTINRQVAAAEGLELIRLVRLCQPMLHEPDDIERN